MARKDANGRNLKTGEYYDSKNNRYQFRKMIDGKRITITSDKLADLRKMSYYADLIKVLFLIINEQK